MGVQNAERDRPIPHSENLSGLAGESRTVKSGVAQDTAQKPVSRAAPAGASAQLGGGEHRARRWALQGWQRSTRRLAKCAPTRPAADWSRPPLGGVGLSRALLD